MSIDLIRLANEVSADGDCGPAGSTPGRVPLTLDRAVHIVNKLVELRHFPFALTLHANILCRAPSIGQRDELSIVGIFQAKHRDTGAPVELTYQRRYPSNLIENMDEPTFIREIVRGSLIEIAIHEVDEALHIDGWRAFDPHSTEEDNQARAEGLRR